MHLRPNNLIAIVTLGMSSDLLISKTHSFLWQNLANIVHHLVNSTGHSENTDEIPRHDEIVNPQVEYMLY